MFAAKFTCQTVAPPDNARFVHKAAIVYTNALPRTANKGHEVDISRSLYVARNQLPLREHEPCLRQLSELVRQYRATVEHTRS
jgi:hypothetical protein